MKNKSIKLSLSLSVLFLLLTIASVSHFLFKSIFFSAGTALLLAAVILALAKKQHKSFWLPCVIMCLAYIMVFSLQFQTRTLDSFMPDGYNVNVIELRSMKSAELLIWDLNSGTVTYPNSGDSFTINSTDINLEQMKSIALRNYWLPGSVKSETVYDLHIRFDYNSRISIYGGRKGISIYSQDNSDDVSVSRWMTFGDIASVLPQEILSAIE